jgi:hypothetical protein
MIRNKCPTSDFRHARGRVLYGIAVVVGSPVGGGVARGVDPWPYERNRQYRDAVPHHCVIVIMRNRNDRKLLILLMSCIH